MSIKLYIQTKNKDFSYYVVIYKKNILTIRTWNYLYHFDYYYFLYSVKLKLDTTSISTIMVRIGHDMYTTKIIPS